MVREILLENAGQAGAARKTYLGECGPAGYSGSCGSYGGSSRSPKKSAPKKKTAPKKDTWKTVSGKTAKRQSDGSVKYTDPKKTPAKKKAAPKKKAVLRRGSPSSGYCGGPSGSC